MVDRSGKPEERNSSNAQIRTLLEEQRQMIIAEYCEKIGHHDLQAAHAEEERRILREELWRQQMDFREVHVHVIVLVVDVVFLVLVLSARVDVHAVFVQLP